MANRFTVNGVTYTAKPFDFDMVCELEDMGVTFKRIDNMPMSLIRAYFAICANMEKDEAAEHIQKHMVNGGKLDDVTTAMNKEMENSDFFRALSENKGQETTESKRKKKEPAEELDTTNQLNIG